MSDDKRKDFKIEVDTRPKETFEAMSHGSPTLSSQGLFRAENQGTLSVLAYCGSSILMTTTNKFVLSADYNLNFLLLAVQVSLYACRRSN
jgi:GDP-mannose transporter